MALGSCVVGDKNCWVFFISQYLVLKHNTRVYVVLRIRRELTNDLFTCLLRTYP